MLSTDPVNDRTCDRAENNSGGEREHADQGKSSHLSGLLVYPDREREARHPRPHHRDELAKPHYGESEHPGRSAIRLANHNRQQYTSGDYHSQRARSGGHFSGQAFLLLTASLLLVRDSRYRGGFAGAKSLTLSLQCWFPVGFRAFPAAAMPWYHIREGPPDDHQAVVWAHGTRQ